MVITKLKGKEYYWSDDPAYGKTVIPPIISAALQLSETASAIGSLSIIPEFVKLLTERYQKHYYPAQDVVIDESIVAFKGRSKMVFYIPQKPHKWGFKIHVLAESETGYVLDMEMDTKEHPHENSTQPVGFHLIDRLVMSSYDERYHILYCDFWYTSLPIIKLLQQKGIYTIGAIRSNKNLLPFKGKYEIHCNTGDITVIRWNDKKLIAIASSVVNCSMIMDKKRKVPAFIDAYTMNMHGVDKLDQKVSRYENRMKEKKCWKRTFYHLLEISICNTHILYEKFLAKKPTGIQFRKKLVGQLYTGYKVITHSNSITASNINLALPAINPKDLHAIGKKQDEKNKRCAYCHKSNIHTCVICNIHICPEHHLDYHATNVYNKQQWIHICVLIHIYSQMNTVILYHQLHSYYFYVQCIRFQITQNNYHHSHNKRGFRVLQNNYHYHHLHTGF
eukprot:TRINITY_DN1085_c0_g1_i15.p1 TRINITY_DN1085_c0_g1~~TRINITY_DN1085_c0_g1_i15.p1  ORF type:complete len:473 (-),score=-9.90 TRINITY_DN1085_c0_g1_i15:159-1502(-)